MMQAILAAALAVAVWFGFDAGAQAQEPDRTYRVGMLTGDRAYAVRTRREMLARLERLGFSARNLVVDPIGGHVMSVDFAGSKMSVTSVTAILRWAMGGK